MPNAAKQRLLLFLLFFPLFWTGCSKEEIKKSENSARIHALYDSLDRLKKNYEVKNPADFFADYASSYPNLENMKKRTGEVFNQFNPIMLYFYLDHIILEKDSSSLVIRWEGEWTHPSEGSVKAGGNSILKFSNETPPLLIEIQGIDPFTSPLKEKRS